TFKSIVKVKYVKSNSGIHKTTGKALVYFRKDSLTALLKYGDIIFIKNKISEIEGPKNPGQFNYKRFLYYKQIYHRAFLTSKDWAISSKTNKKSIYAYILELRYKIVKLIRTKIPNSDESSIANALLVGYKAELSDDVRQSFAETGAMHVLAVSGLHVGIIFMVFSLFLKFLKRDKFGRIVYFIIIVLILWFYAIITGLSPSVSRAATMFTFVLIGQSINRLSNIYASILTSLLFLLMINPFMITQVGFQLSYAAVIGIVFLQPKIYSIFTPRFWLIDKIWALFAVSLAAQIATFPLGFFYFNQFPVYFFVSNLIVIPAAMIIIYTGLAFLTFEMLSFTQVSDVIANILEFIIHCLNKIILLIRELPGGLIKEFYLSEIGLILLYSSIIFLLIYLVRKKTVLLIFTITFLILFMANKTNLKYKNLTNNRVVFYSINDRSLIGFFKGKDVSFWGDSIALNDYYTLKYNTFRDLWRNGIKEKNVNKIEINSDFKNNNLLIKRNFIKFGNKRIFVIDEKFKIPEFKIKTDVVMFRNNPYIELKKIQEDIEFDKIIFDASNSWWKVKYWIDECEKLGINYIDIRNDEALILEL
ncbi:MAG: ComEC/Rec2 family competence protein, partial [Bacteroidota bacterium]|nr:ComEC/Rec2 family competence protein [Bacteroidota bacterium]